MSKTTHASLQPLCEQMAWRIPIHWTDRVGIHVLDDDRRAKLTLSTSGTHEHWTGFKVEIVSKTNGLIDSHFVPFHPVLTTGIDRYAAHIWRAMDGRFEWYDYDDAPEPDTARYCEIVEQYIGEWR